MKCDIRVKLLILSHSVKLNYYCNLININPSCLTRFLKGSDNAISLDKLNLLLNVIKNDLNQKIA